jgi:SAM-dependent methyltransferase
MTQSSDPRSVIYRDLESQLLRENARAQTSARAIFQLLFEYIQPRSVLDVGCGLGGWLKVAQEMGITDIKGIEGDWADEQKLEIDAKLIDRIDLEKGFSLGRKFDLVMTLEVAEHLSPAAADAFVQSLVHHGDIVLFSAAIPFQIGHHHVNEQYPSYWVLKFAQHQFRAVDFLRPRIWDNDQVAVWFRQNILLFVHDRVLAENRKLREEMNHVRPMNLVHPAIHDARMRHYLKARELMKYLAEPGVFEVVRNPDGQMLIVRK